MRSSTRPGRAPLLPELELLLAQDAISLWEHTERVLGGQQAPPFWAFCWAGGQALARYLLDHPAQARGKAVLDLAAGGGVVALAAARSGARRVDAVEIDPLAVRAITLNARANDLPVHAHLTDVLGPGPVPADLAEPELVLAGDVFYDRAMSALVQPYLQAHARRGARVLVGDPGRAYLPAAGLRRLAELDVPVPATLEDRDVRRTTIWAYEAG